MSWRQARKRPGLAWSSEQWRFSRVVTMARLPKGRAVVLCMVTIVVGNGELAGREDAG
jgi:hypothetical protein